MRIFKGFGEAVNEIRRDLAELSVEVHPETWQGRSVVDDEAFNSKEVCNYSYTVTQPVTTLSELLVDQPWADAEFQERVCQHPQNPGKAWTLRKNIWQPFLEHGQGIGRGVGFDYTYSERLSEFGTLQTLIRKLKESLHSRQLFLSVWDRTEDTPKLLHHRVPCSLGYWFNYRRGQLNITYLQRSADFAEHFQNDIYLAVKLLMYVARKADLEVGMFTHWLGSLHVFSKDVKGVF